MDNRDQWNSLFATSFGKRKGKDEMEDEPMEKVFIVGNDDEKVEFFQGDSPLKDKYGMKRSKIVTNGRPLVKCSFCAQEFPYRYDVHQVIKHYNNCTEVKDEKDKYINLLKGLISRQSEEKKKQAKNQKKQQKLEIDRVII